jgi:hypothetical protein
MSLESDAGTIALRKLSTRKPDGDVRSISRKLEECARVPTSV